MANKIKKIALNITERQMQMIETVKEKDGLSTMTEVFGLVLAFYIRKIEPHYLSQGAIKTGKTPEERAKEAIDLKTAKDKHLADTKFATKKNICEVILGGEVFKDSSGGHSCRYSTHFAEGTDEQQILPLDMVNESYSNYQFFPDKAKVFEKRPELKERFEKLQQ